MYNGFTNNNCRPEISIVIPVYNSIKYIDQCIKSIFNQTYSDWELILIDDMSTDGTREYIESITDNRVLKLYNDKNYGIAYTTNRGFDNCHGKYITMMDDDDEMLPFRLKIEKDFLECHDDIDFIGGREIDIDEHGSVISYCDIPKNNPKFIRATLLFKMVNITNCSTMFKRNLLTRGKIRIKDGYYGIQDMVFFGDCSRAGNITSIDIPVVKHRIYNESYTRRTLFGDDKTVKHKREEAYRRFLNYSFKQSGFRLSNDQVNIIYNEVGELGKRCNSQSGLMSLQNVLKEILTQADRMKIDYYNELYICCRNIMLGALKRFDIFGSSLSTIKEL